MHLQIDLGSRTPIYVQIIECVKRGIASGELSAGTKLPPVRRLADELSVSKLTVFRAYTELQEAGLVTGRPGQGTVIAPLNELSTPKKHPAAQSVAKFTSDNRSARDRSFANVGPDPELFDFVSWLDEMTRLKAGGAWNFFFPSDLGEPDMIEAGATVLKRFRTSVVPEEVVVLGRGNEIACRLAHGLVPQGAHVLIQEPHTVGAEETLSGLGFVPHGVSVSEAGIDLDQTELLLRSHSVKVAFVEPTFGYGDGRVWPTVNRRAFMRLMAKHNVLVVERLAAAELSFVDDLPPTLANLAPDANIISELPLSESIAPGIGIGVAALPQSLMPWFERSRQQTGMSVNVPTQLAMANMVTSGRYMAHFARVVPVYRSRRDALVRALWKSAPFLKVNVPAGGLSLEVTLPVSVDPHVLFEESLGAGAPIMPGRFLTTRGRGGRTARLSYGLMTPEMSRSAVASLAPVLETLIVPAKKTGTI